MNKIKNYLMLWLIPLLLVILMNGCDDRVGITSPSIIATIPTVSSTNPINAATDVPFNQKVAATFSEAMNSSTITTATFTLMQGTSFVSGTISYTGITATFTPASNLAPNTSYTATITTGAEDVEGSALSANYVWSFNTGDAAVIAPPTVISTDPANAEIEVPINQKISATFSTGMDASTITASSFTLKQGTTSVSGFVSYAGVIAIFAPASNLAPNTLYTATITTGAEDLAGNALANNYVWSFTTGAVAVVVPPIVTTTDPANNAVCVALNTQITATFSKTMDASTITTGAFTIMQGSRYVSGTVSYIGKIATFIPESDLLQNTTYVATITTTAKDLAGNSMASNYVWSFTTITPYTVTLSSNPTLGGTTSGGGTFMSCSSVTVNAAANAGYTFTNWTENGSEVSTDASYTFTIDGNTTLVANFEIRTYTLTTTAVNGTVTANPDQANYDAGSIVTITAFPAAGYTFDSWSGDASGSTNPKNITMDANKNITANFVIRYSVSLSSNPVAGGTTSGSGTFDSGSFVTVIATPEFGYTFTNWTKSGVEVSTDATYSFTITGNTVLVANFAISGGGGGQAAVNLGTAARFAILSHSDITNIPTSSITGDVGISPGLRSNVTGFTGFARDPGLTYSTSTEVNGGLPGIYAANDDPGTPAMLIQAKADAEAAYLDAVAAGRGTPISISGNLNGLTLVPGLYESGSSIQISPGGILTLDAGGDAGAVFVIRSATSITTEATSAVVLAGSADAANIFWVAGSAITLGTNSSMKGTLIASTSISLLTGAALQGRALIQSAAAGQVSLDRSTIVLP